MFDERLARFSRERLGGRPVPEDLRLMLTAGWEGREDVVAAYGITFLEPGERDPLVDHDYLTEQDRADPDIAANCAAFVRMTAYLKTFARGEDGDFYGYWLHPDEPAGRPPAVVRVDTEGSYLLLSGSGFAEGCAAEFGYDSAEDFAELVERFGDIGITVTARSADELGTPELAREPEELHHEFYNDERRGHGLEPVPPLL
ncbi:hypothetical protein HUT18_14545 [Streptomyces sp. NA04227]|uniref:hypothetical protein n=1 Tax=Streptomyces sp. NA04227 TaxID=2742136 RepID=UPI0015917E91|nr:hypothetical protein [Streptomyces sp. NA04227]QKW07422.1 hypothetical protein HUT18_14545 [Streptomyces sp. NA04227]